MMNNDFPEVYFRKMKDVDEKFLVFLENQDEINENFIIFNEYLKDQKISENKYELKSFLYLINSISSNYHRSSNFFIKIELILKSLQENIKNNFKNFEIFNIFQKNKRILLSLFKLGILTPTEDIYSIINYKFINAKYLEYFYPEFESFIDNKKKNSIRSVIQELTENNSIDEFNKKREIGENDDYLCELIRNDSVVDFITYLEKTNISPISTIQPSIYETNSFLLNGTHELINYSAFYGSLQIIRYLFSRNVTIDSSIWLYAIHGRNAEVIQFLEEKMIKTIQNSFQYLIIESIKCHHNEISIYLMDNFCQEEKIYYFYLYRKALKHYNFSFLNNEIVNSLIDSCKFTQKLNIPYYLSKYDYFLIVEYIFKLKHVSKRFLFFKKSKNYLDVNYQYTLYKPSTDQFKQFSLDMIKKIAIKNGDIDDEKHVENYNEYDEVTKYLIELEKERERTYDIETSTIFNIAARKGNIDIIQFLLSIPKININIKSIRNCKIFLESNLYSLETEEKTVLHEAVESGYTEVVQFLLNNIKSLDVNCMILTNDCSHYDNCFSFSENYKKTLLHHAIEKGYIGIIKLLLNQKVDINLKSTSEIDKSGGCDVFISSKKKIEKSSLYYAIVNERVNIIKLLLDKSEIDIIFGIKETDISNKSNNQILREETPLCLAIEMKNLEIVQLLLKQPKIDINYESTFSIFQNDKPNIVKMTALVLASEMKDNEIYQLLLSKQSNK